MKKPSVTYWNRVEPSPRSDSLVRGLEAAVRDPLWFLARQWQMGEFQGEDAGSPSAVSLKASQSSFTSWTVAGQPSRPYDGEAPLEALVESEAVTPNWFLAVETGQLLERLLREEGAGSGTIGLFRNAFQVPAPGDLSPVERRDQALVQFLRICGGRSLDGLAALEAAADPASAVAAIGISAGSEQGAAIAALEAFVALVRSTYGRIGRQDAPAWTPRRLDYDVEVGARTPGGDDARMRAVVGPNGGFDWYAFDEIARTEADRADRETIAFSLFPTNVNFAGMPNSRWWQFEDAKFNWTNVDADRREIAKTMVLDFMLVQGNDWFLVPIGQKVGSLAAIDQLLVRDVFGEYTIVDRADSADRRGGRWTMFSTAIETGEGEQIADYFVLAPSALRTTLDGPDLEEVRFLRDEQANLVWGIEARIENGIGRGWPGHERALTFADETPVLPETDAPLRYRLQTFAPIHWIPFPPVQIDASRRAVALERASMQRWIDGALVGVEPVGRVLNPTNVEDPNVYRINEEEVSRSGTRILRAGRRTRWLDGSTHSWISRRRRAGLGEGSSGLRYDIAEQTGSNSDGS